MGAASPPPSGGSSGLARASPALFAEKVLTRHKHHRKSTPPLRKTPTAQKALRALRPWLGHAGSTKFGRPQKTQAFFGAPELRPRAGVICHRAQHLSKSSFPALKTISAHQSQRRYYFSVFYNHLLIPPRFPRPSPAVLAGEKEHQYIEC
ncbi:MAG: hypothetical protein GYA62_15255 [Bacteroidales bacterium]|nr:hypothetical protein [Bacteroidales bacterium]